MLIGAPRWLLAATVVFTLLILFMALAETTLWTHFLVDRGEYISIAGLAFIFATGLWLYSNRRLKASLPLFIPWLIYPVLTQGDELIDNLTINQMRVVCHVILAILFGAPILMIVLAAKRLTRRGVCLLVIALLLAEVWLAFVFLGDLMVATILLMGLVFFFAQWALGDSQVLRRFTERMALVVMLAGVFGSLGVFVGFKNRPGVYQGSPAAYLDPAQKDARYDFARVPAEMPATVPDETSSVLGDYARVLLAVNHAHYVLDRNYNYTFHNSLFLRRTPIVPGFREKSLEEIRSAQVLAQATDARVNAMAANRLLQDLREFTAYTLRRSALLEKMSAEFVKTEAGTQHATHLYEGEGKLLDDQFAALLQKHSAAIERLGDAATPLVDAGEQIHSTYGNRIVGF